MDKNMAQIFIIWDKLFGSFQEELPHVVPVYGITRPMRTWNPIKINFKHMWLLITDAWKTNDIKAKFQLWFKPTGWRPADLEAKSPVFKIEDVYHFEKYQTKRTNSFYAWVWLQIVLIFIIVAYFLGNIASIGVPNIFIYGAFVYVYIYALTDFMDGNPSSLFWELLKSIFGISIIVFIGDWFGADKYYSLLSKLMIAYFVLSLIVTYTLHKKELSPEKAVA
jgi:hypothetical protein